MTVGKLLDLDQEECLTNRWSIQHQTSPTPEVFLAVHLLAFTPLILTLFLPLAAYNSEQQLELINELAIRFGDDGSYSACSNLRLQDPVN